MADEKRDVVFVESSSGDYQIDAKTGAVIKAPGSSEADDLSAFARPVITRFDLLDWSVFHRKEIEPNDILSILDLGYYHRHEGQELYEPASMDARVEQHIIKTAEDGIDLRDFDGIEVEPCALVGKDEDGTEILERTDRDSPNIFCWTVYGHYSATSGMGGVEALADYPTSDHANAAAVIYEAERVRLSTTASNTVPLPSEAATTKPKTK